MNIKTLIFTQFFQAIVAMVHMIWADGTITLVVLPAFVQMFNWKD